MRHRKMYGDMAEIAGAPSVLESIDAFVLVVTMRGGRKGRKVRVVVEMLWNLERTVHAAEVRRQSEMY